jgi:hypothetical protein
MALERRVVKLETYLSPQRWIYTTHYYEACEAEQTALDRIHARWPVTSQDMILILRVEAMGGCPLQGKPHHHGTAEVQRMLHR